MRVARWLNAAEVFAVRRRFPRQSWFTSVCMRVAPCPNGIVRRPARDLVLRRGSIAHVIQISCLGHSVNSAAVVYNKALLR